MQSAFIKVIQSLLDQGIEEGMLRPVDTEVVAAMLKALLDGVEGLHALRYPIEMNRYLSAAIELLLTGLAKRD